MDAAKSVSEPLHGFMIDSVRLVRRCNKPDRKGRQPQIPSLPSHCAANCKHPNTVILTDRPEHLTFASSTCEILEFIKISSATAIGFAVMGFIGFFVRLIHIPVNSILLGKSQRDVDAIFSFRPFRASPIHRHQMLTNVLSLVNSASLPIPKG